MWYVKNRPRKSVIGLLSLRPAGTPISQLIVEARKFIISFNSMLEYNKQMLREGIIYLHEIRHVLY